MARGNLIQGQGSGKVGDIVLMVRQGQQVSRVYTTSGSRSGKEASEASRIQRVKFGGAANQWNLYRYICTRMFRSGRSTRMSDYNFFTKRNQPLFPFFTKLENLNKVHVLQPGIFSSGTFGRIELIESYPTSYVEGETYMQLLSTTIAAPYDCGWKSTMSTLKSLLARMLPSARKVTYVFSMSSEVTISEGGESFVSQQVAHYPVIIDLYKEVVSGEDAQTLAEYFSTRIDDAALKAIIAAQTSSAVAPTVLFLVAALSAEQITTLNRMSILMFATDDDASDCYTTEIPESGVNPTVGAYAAWAGYRTQSALRLASDSYGYQQGVMRDDIASLGNDISTAVTAHIAKLRQVSAKAADEYAKSVGDVSKVQAKVVRKSAEEK